MNPAIDHVALPAREPEGAARWLAEILGVGSIEPEGSDGDMYSVGLAGCSVLFMEAEAVPNHHIAFRVDGRGFAAVVERLQAAAIPFGNDPEEPANGETWDPLGGSGRVYFVSADDHLFEVTVG